MDLVAQKENLCYLIGETVIRFQLLEHWIADHLVSELNLKTKDSTFIMLDSMSYKQKVTLLFELYNRNPDRKCTNTKKAKNCLLKAEEFRNKIVHSIWSVNNNDWFREKGNLNSKNGFRKVKNNINFEEFQKCNNSILKIEMWEFLSDEELTEILKTLTESSQKI
jgi:hypothetical protein